MNIKNGFVSFDDCLRISPEAHRLLRKSEIEPETVLLTMSGSVGNATVALPTWQYPINSNQDIAKIITSGIDPYYLTSFFGCHYGKTQMGRLPVGSVQQHIFLSMIETIIIARLDDVLEVAIGNLCRSAYETRDIADQRLKQAENLILDTLGLRSWSPPEPLTYFRSAASMASAGRFDAEFAAPKVQALLARLSISSQSIADVADVRREKFQPAIAGSFDYIEIGDLDSFGRCISEAVPMDEAPSRATWYVRPSDVITSTVRPIRRLSSIVSDQQDGDVCSSGFVVLTPRTISSECLLTYLRLPLICELLHLFATASMYPALSERDLLALPIPHIDADTDAAVSAAVRSSRVMLDRSEMLLAAAKQAVEIAIEDGEVAALAFIAEQESIHA